MQCSRIIVLFDNFTEFQRKNKMKRQRQFKRLFCAILWNCGKNEILHAREKISSNQFRVMFVSKKLISQNFWDKTFRENNRNA